MFEQLDDIKKQHQKIAAQLQDPNLMNEAQKYQSLAKKFAELEKIVLTYNQYQKITHDIEQNQELLKTEKDDELQQMAKDELVDLEKKKQHLIRELQMLLLPKDPNDEKDVIIEIRAGAGGDEASLFAQELFRAYCLFAENQKWQIQLLSQSYGNVGGVKEVIASCSGTQVYSRLKFESGVHRVQRVPKTESQGRVHTSTVTVAILPEADEVDVKVEAKDLRIDVYRSSGPGGQSVNTTDSAVRVTHIPTGLIVTCQDGKSQHSNKQQALKVLYSRLFDLEREKQQKSATDQRLAQIGTGDRSQRIRTYNFPQSRITDHRIALTTHTLNQVMQGDMLALIDAVRTYYQLEALKKSP